MSDERIKMLKDRADMLALSNFSSEQVRSHIFEYAQSFLFKSSNAFEDLSTDLAALYITHPSIKEQLLQQMSSSEYEEYVINFVESFQYHCFVAKSLGVGS